MKKSEIVRALQISIGKYGDGDVIIIDKDNNDNYLQYLEIVPDTLTSNCYIKASSNENVSEAFKTKFVHTFFLSAILKQLNSDNPKPRKMQWISAKRFSYFFISGTRYSYKPAIGIEIIDLTHIKFQIKATVFHPVRKTESGKSEPLYLTLFDQDRETPNRYHDTITFLNQMALYDFNSLIINNADAVNSIISFVNS